jgi:GT2 family glycosyltransferase
MSSRITVVVLAYNGLEDTLRCLSSLEGQIGKDLTINVLLADNGSTDGTSESVAQMFPWCSILRIDRNAGPAAGNNRGIEHALKQNADWIILLNNDTTVVPDFLARMHMMADSPGEYSILGPIINYMDEPDTVMTDGVEFNPEGFLGFFKRLQVSTGHTWPAPISEVDVVNGCCMMIHAEVFRCIGFFDESYFIYHDETDFCLRARLAGFRAGVFAGQLVWHKGSSSFQTTGQSLQRYYDARNLGTLVWRYGGKLPHRRSRTKTIGTYLRYVTWRYITERESGHEDSANAVIDGFLDSFTRKLGPRTQRRRVLSPMFKWVFNVWMRVASNT